jgi:hypothetical protein
MGNSLLRALGYKHYTGDDLTRRHKTLAMDDADVRLIRFRGHLLKEGYDVHDGNHQGPAPASAIHRRI